MFPNRSVRRRSAVRRSASTPRADRDVHLRPSAARHAGRRRCRSARCRVANGVQQMALAQLNRAIARNTTGPSSGSASTLRNVPNTAAVAGPAPSPALRAFVVNAPHFHRQISGQERSGSLLRFHRATRPSSHPSAARCRRGYDCRFTFSGAELGQALRHLSHGHHDRWKDHHQTLGQNPRTQERRVALRNYGRDFRRARVDRGQHHDERIPRQAPKAAHGTARF